MLSFFKCIIWLALAATAEIPPVVCAFLAIGRYLAHPFKGFPSLGFEWWVPFIQMLVHGRRLIPLLAIRQMFGMKYGLSLLSLFVGG